MNPRFSFKKKNIASNDGTTDSGPALGRDRQPSPHARYGGAAGATRQPTRQLGD